MNPAGLGGSAIALLRPFIEQRLSGKLYAEVWKSVNVAFAGDSDEERDFWDYALGLPDLWQAMSRAPTKAVKEAVIEIAAMAESLANKIVAFGPELLADKGYVESCQHVFIVQDLRIFAADLNALADTTEAMRARPRSMSKDSAERTYCARALTLFLLGGGHKPMARIVSITVRALLELSVDEDFDEKQVRDVTEDICKQFKAGPTRPRRRSAIL